MTLPQYRELAAYWRKFPPMHLLFSSVLRYKGETNGTNDMSDLMAVFGKGGDFADS
jgi:hypothetical protein